MSKTTNRFNTLDQIVSNLERGDFTTIGKKTGYDASYVRRVLLGGRNPNLDILNAASSLLNSRHTRNNKTAGRFEVA